MKNNKITFLGPVGATFSHDAYEVLAEIYNAPVIEPETASNCIPVATNGEILRAIATHGGYGTIAMETMAEGRVAEPLESFIELIKLYKDNMDCPLRVIGAVRHTLHICLLARHGITRDSLTTVIAHPKALGACKENILKLGVSTTTASSNGEAARLIAVFDGHNDKYKTAAALGPRSAAKKYGLTILDDSFEDSEAITTFFLIGPNSHTVSVGANNRILIIFKAPHRPGGLVDALKVFNDERLNLIQIHSVHAGKQTYNFAIEVDVREPELEALERAMKQFESRVEKYLSFGPFEIISK